MRLSEQLKQDNDCGDFGRALEGYAERAETLEAIGWKYFYQLYRDEGCDHIKAVNIADKRMAEI